MSPHGCRKRSAKPCNRYAEESFLVLGLNNQTPKPPNYLLIQDKAFYSLGPHCVGRVRLDVAHGRVRRQRPRGPARALDDDGIDERDHVDYMEIRRRYRM